MPPRHQTRERSVAQTFALETKHHVSTRIRELTRVSILEANQLASIMRRLALPPARRLPQPRTRTSPLSEALNSAACHPWGNKRFTSVSKGKKACTLVANFLGRSEQLPKTQAAISLERSEHLPKPPSILMNHRDPPIFTSEESMHSSRKTSRS